MEIKFRSKKIRELLAEQHLHIPAYQRPYKWERKHVRNLFYDLREAMDRDSYQIGSVILHENEELLDIVDGQQRLISISLFLHAIGSLGDFPGAQSLLEAEYGEISCHNAAENAKEWKNLIQLVGEAEAGKVLNFLLEQCEISVISIPKERLAEAFQLFDSQNNRGKSLAPHDLLKAYHLRRIPEAEEHVVEKWEQFIDDKDLNLLELFDKHLFRMRRWSRGETGLTRRRYASYLQFTEYFIDDFKGVDIRDKENNYPYLELYQQLTHISTSIGMPIIDGEYFFKFIEDSHEKIVDFSKTLNEKMTLLPEEAQTILGSNKGRYVRNYNLFKNLSLLFMERFGEESLNKEVLEMIFIWSYYPRVKARAINDASLGNYAAGGKFRNQEAQKIFQTLANVSTPANFLAKIDTSLFEHMTISDIVEKEQNKW